VLCAAEGHHGRLIGGIHAVGSETIGPIEILLAPTGPGEDPHIELVGIGAVLAAKDDGLVIGKVIAGGGAADAGLVAGDAILAVDAVRVTVLGFETAIQKIRGAEGTSVTLLVRRAAGGEPANVTVVRKRIKA
jgi:C-terminal processing protease CtpA/Prc